MRAKALLILAAAILAACGRPVVVESFVGAADAPEGVYSFSADMTDSLSVYDISFYTRIDARRSRAESLDLRIVLAAPSGTVYSESAKMPLRPAKGGGYFSRTSLAKYRSGLRPVESGIWKIEIRVQDPPEGFRGFGLVTRRKDGTR